MMNKNTCLSIGLVFLIQLLSITFGGPVQFSLTSIKINSHPLLGRKLDRIEQLFPNITRSDDPLLTQHTTRESEKDIIHGTTIDPLMAADKNLPYKEEKLVSKVKHREPALQSSSVFVSAIAPHRLFYLSEPVYQPKYRPAARDMQYRNRLTRRENAFPFRPLESTPAQSKHLGFPPISNTRENLGKQINWNAKLGRAHPSFYDNLTA